MQKFTLACYAVSACNRSLKTTVKRIAALLSLLIALSFNTSSAQVNLSISGSSGLSSVLTGQVFEYSLLYSCSSLTDDGNNAVITIPLAANLYPADKDNISNAVNVNGAQVQSVSYDNVLNTITIYFKNPLPAGTSGTVQVGLRYEDGVTPDGYDPGIHACFDAANNAAGAPVCSDTTSVVAQATQNLIIKKRKIAGGALDNITIFRIEIFNNTSSSYGSFNISNAVVKDVLDEGAEFVSGKAFNGSSDPYYDPSDSSIKWEFNEDILPYNYYVAYVKIKYNSSKYAIGDEVINCAQLSGFVPDLPLGETKRVTDKSCTDLIIETPDPVADCFGGGISPATAPENLYKHILAGTSCNWFGNGWYNPGNTELDQVQVVQDIDKNITYGGAYVFPVTDILGEAADANTVVEFATNLRPDFFYYTSVSSLDVANGTTPAFAGMPDLDNGEYITQVRFTVSDSLPIGGFQSLGYCGDARTAAQGAVDGSAITEGDTYDPANPGDDGTLVFNSSAGSYTFEGNTTAYNMCKGKAEILKPSPVFAYKTKYFTNSIGRYSPADTISHYYIQVYMGGNLPGEDVVITDTLDARLSYVSGSGKLYVGSNSPVPITPAVNGQILSWNLGTLANAEYYNIEFDASILPGTAPGTICNSAYVSSSNSIGAGFNGTTCVDVISAVALRAYKGQSGCNNDVVYYPNIAPAQAGGKADYKVTIVNLGNVPAKDLVIVDVFPFKDDTRGSQWFANLAGPITLDDSDAVVYYDTVSNPCITDVNPPIITPGCKTPDWSLQAPVDITTVAAIKITREASFKVFDSLIFSWPMRVPVNTPDNLTMYNAVTYQASRADNSIRLLPSTPKKVGMQTNCTPALGSVGDYVWVDANGNGVQDEGVNSGLNGVRVYLYNAGGDNQIGGGDDILADSSISGDDFTGKPGYYAFVKVPSGKYYVQFQQGYDGRSFTSSNQADQTDGNSDADEATGNSELFTINASGTGSDRNNLTIDAGYTCNDNITVTAKVKDETVYNAADGSIDITVNPVGAYTYQWSNGATTQDISGLTGGTYTVKISDQWGCGPEKQYVVESGPCFMDVSGTTQDVACHGTNTGGIDITVSGANGTVSYAWNNGATTEDLSGLSGGIYSVTVSDASGCSVSQSFTITEPSALTVSATPGTILCNGLKTRVVVTASGGVEPYNGTGTFNVGGGIHTFVVTDANGCSSSATINIPQPDPIVITGTVTDVTTANGSDGAIDISVTGGTQPYLYVWADGVVGEDRTNITAGLYVINITDTNGCENSESFIVLQPGCNLIGSVTTTKLTSCYKGKDGTATASAIGGSGSYSYKWSTGDTSQTINNLRKGYYQVIITDKVTGCKDTAVGCVLNPDPVKIKLDITPNTPGQCNGKVVMTPYSGTPPYKYKWNDGDTSSVRSNLCPGRYRVTVTDGASCTTTYIFSIGLCKLYVNVVDVLPATCTTTCDGYFGMQASGGKAPYTYVWNDGYVGNKRNRLCAGDYIIKITDARGCSTNLNVHIDAKCTNRCYPFYKGGNGITSSDFAVIEYSSEEEMPAVPELRLSASPNPARGFVNLLIISPENIRGSISLTDINGRVVKTMTENISKGTSSVKMDLAGIAKGIYMVRLVTGDEVKTIKLLVE